MGNHYLSDKSGLCLVLVYGVVVTLSMISCNSGDYKPSVSKSEIVAADTTKHDELTLPYQPEYFTIDSAVLSIKVFSMPELFNLESLMSQAQKHSASGRFLYYGIDSIYQVTNSQIDLKFCEANEVGFRKRYEHFTTATVSKGHTLDCGLSIGQSADVLLEIPDQEENAKMKRIRVDKLSEIQFYDNWDIYTHTYHINDGKIESLTIEF